MPRPPVKSPEASYAHLEARLVRIESRLVQLMLHVGLSPYDQTYVVPQAVPNGTPPAPGSQK